jgi:hypothetical protein
MSCFSLRYHLTIEAQYNSYMWVINDILNFWETHLISTKTGQKNIIIDFTSLNIYRILPFQCVLMMKQLLIVYILCMRMIACDKFFKAHVYFTMSTFSSVISLTLGSHLCIVWDRPR